MRYMGVFVYMFFYPALALSACLCLSTYLPVFLQKYVAAFLNTLLFSGVRCGRVHLKSLHIILSVCVFMLWNEYNSNATLTRYASNDLGYNVHYLDKKFLAERNVWITSFTLTLWVLLNRITSQMKDLGKERERVHNLLEAAKKIS